jgi:hypothetical protein
MICSTVVAVEILVACLYLDTPAINRSEVGLKIRRQNALCLMRILSDQGTAVMQF